MTEASPTEPSLILRALARRLADTYRAHTSPAAILLTGSAAEGCSDWRSDLDLIVYYDRLPSTEAVGLSRARVGGVNVRPIGPAGESGFAEAFDVDGVQCQVVHATIDGWEEEMATVLERLDVTSPIQKAISGLLAGMPLHGAPLIATWRARAAYPEPLARAMVEHHLRFFPIWLLYDRLAARDANIWIHETLTESAYHVLGVLAGLNRVYFSTFQFKRMRRFTASLPLAPANVADRLDSVLSAEPARASADLEALVQECVELVQRHMPEIDAASASKTLGKRDEPWGPRA